MNKLIILSIILLTLCLRVASEPKDINKYSLSNTNDSIYETVYEHEYADTIVDAIFDTATVSIEEAKKMGWMPNTQITKNVESINILYPLVIIGKNQVLFYNESNELINNLNLNIKAKYISKDNSEESITTHARVILSPNNEYITIISPTTIGYGDYEECEIIVYNKQGIMMWKRSNEFVGQDIILSYDGKTLVAGIDPVFDRLPKIIREDTVIQLNVNDLEKIMCNIRDISTNGDILITGSMAHYKGEVVKSMLLLFDQNGELKWEKEYENFIDYGGISNNPERIIVNEIGDEEEVLKCYNIEGNEIWAIQQDLSPTPPKILLESNEILYIYLTELGNNSDVLVKKIDINKGEQESEINCKIKNAEVLLEKCNSMGNAIIIQYYSNGKLHKIEISKNGESYQSYRLTTFNNSKVSVFIANKIE